MRYPDPDYGLHARDLRTPCGARLPRDHRCSVYCENDRGRIVHEHGICKQIAEDHNEDELGHKFEPEEP